MFAEREQSAMNFRPGMLGNAIFVVSAPTKGLFNLPFFSGGRDYWLLDARNPDEAFNEDGSPNIERIRQFIADSRGSSADAAYMRAEEAYVEKERSGVGVHYGIRAIFLEKPLP